MSDEKLPGEEKTIDGDVVPNPASAPAAGLERGDRPVEVSAVIAQLMANAELGRRLEKLEGGGVKFSFANLCHAHRPPRAMGPVTTGTAR